ncbi:MAG: hypothetical protein A4S09_11810 [Proteobacteria bacterium SG_bin7]|nr:MAG: hypothetical protein A4S09_11810 [Proteobacteria bacterium SG_bin7]
MTEVHCPTCQKKVKYNSENIFRPFCSERCKLIDLGQWAEESYKVPCQEEDKEKIFSDINVSEDDQN